LNSGEHASFEGERNAPHASPSPASRGAERPRTPQSIFDRVAPYYDTLNSVLSLGLDRRWRRATARALAPLPGERVLDVATGTGALAMETYRHALGTVSVVGCDVNERMLSVARQRVERAGAPIELVRGDAVELPFDDETFDGVTIAFAIDDVSDREACAREMRRVLRPGGRIAILELAQPDAPVLRLGYRAYLTCFRLFGRHGYAHLEREIATYRGASAVHRLLESAGFGNYRHVSLTFGAARLHVAEKIGGTA
jgi:demethylmenaquinone methyltransferase/2-methoxy-6-polyprenyl-1,4-benzoquinol methylase